MAISTNQKPTIYRNLYENTGPAWLMFHFYHASYQFSKFYLYQILRWTYFVYFKSKNEMKWTESGFRPPLCTYRLNWARRTSWGWWDDWDDTVLQTQDSKFEPWRSEAEHATSRSRRLPTILTFTRGWGRNIFCFFQTAETGNRTPNSGVKGSGANHYPRAPALSLTELDHSHTVDLVIFARLYFSWISRGQIREFKNLVKIIFIIELLKINKNREF